MEVADLDGGHRAVQVGDAKHPTGPAPIVAPAEWAAFTAGIRDGKFG